MTTTKNMCTTFDALVKITITTILLYLGGNFNSMTILVDGYGFEPISLVLAPVSTSYKTLSTTRSLISLPKNQDMTKNSYRTSRHHQNNNFCSNPTSTALPLYLDPSQSLSTKYHHSHKNHQSPSALSYRNDKNVDEQIVSLVEDIYKNNNLILKNDDNVDRDTGISTSPQKKSYLLLIGVEEEPPKAHHPPLANASRQPHRSFMTLMSTEGIFERLRPENGLQPYQPNGSVPSSRLPTVVRPAKTPAYHQRISFFEGGEPFFSLSNLEYGVSSNVTNDAACTGLLVAFLVCMSMIHPFALDYYHDYSSETTFNNMKLISSLVLSIPIVTTYLSITRSTVGTFTRTMSTFWMNWMRLLVVSGTKATALAVDGSSLVKEIVHGTTSTNFTTNDVAIIPPVVKPSTVVGTTQHVERVEPLPSIPILLGELVWYSSLAVVQQANNVIAKTTNSILNYQVKTIRTNRLQVHERKQRNLLKAQIHYSNMKREKQQLLTKQSEPLFLLGEEEFTSGVVTNEYIMSPQNEHVFLLGDGERDEILNMDATLHLHGNVEIANEECKTVDSNYENLFQLGENERDNLLLKSKTHHLLGNIELNQFETMAAVSDDQFVPFQRHVHGNIEIANEEYETVDSNYENIFQLGENERDDLLLKSKTHHLLGNIELKQNETIAVVSDDRYLSSHEGLFHLGQLERDDLNIETKTHHLVGNIENATRNVVASKPSKCLFQLGQEERDDLNIKEKSHCLLGNIENAPQSLVAPRQTEPLFQLGQEERDDRLLETLENVTQRLVDLHEERDAEYQSEHLFYSGDVVRHDMSSNTATIQLFGNVDQQREMMPMLNKNIYTGEQEDIENVHRLIQERARTETKKRLLALAESKSLLGDEVVKLNELQGPMKNESKMDEIASPRTLNLQRSWKSLSYKVGKVKNYLTRQGKMIRLNRYTMVQRGALYLVAATSSLFVNYLGKPPRNDHDDTEADVPAFVSNHCK